MNIAFPLPFSQMTSVLRIDHERGDGVRLTTARKATQDLRCDQGVYLAGLGLTVRLPIDETIDVWMDGELRATHTMWICGFHYLTLTYVMKPA
jgi:hypothetical protein